MKKQAFVVVLTLSVILMMGACSKKKNYYEDFKAEALFKDFKCDNPPAGKFTEACRVLKEFSSATPFNAWPTSGVETWWGPKYCRDTPKKEEEGISFEFGHVELQPGPGKIMEYDEYEKVADKNRVIPTGIKNLMTWISKVDPGEIESFLTALKEGRKPSFKDDDQKTRWEGFTRKISEGHFYALYKTDGPSVQEGAGYPTDYLRGSGKKLLMIHPSREIKDGKPTGAYQNPCVAEMWKVVR